MSGLIGRSLVCELETVVYDRATARKTREQFRDGPSWQARIAKREAAVRAHLESLSAQAAVLIADAPELDEARGQLEKLRTTFDRAIAARHQQLDAPAHRPNDRHFYAACDDVMKRHAIGPTEAARIIVERIAPQLSPKARVDLLGLYRKKDDQIHHLAGNIRNGCRRLKRQTQAD